MSFGQDIYAPAFEAGVLPQSASLHARGCDREVANIESQASPPSTLLDADETLDQIRATAERYHAEYPWADADAIEVYLSLVHAQRTIAAGLERYLGSLPLPKTTTSARHTVLRTLYFARARLSQNQIGRELGVSRTNITNLMDGLEDEGLIRRVANPDDRRSNYVELTPEGERLCDVLIPAVTKFMVDGLRGFSPEQRSQLSEYLARFRAEIEAEHLR